MRAKQIALMVALLVTAGMVCSAGEDRAMNVFEHVPDASTGIGRKKLVDEEYLLMMQVALAPGGRVPQHVSDSNVHLLVLRGDVVVNLGGTDHAVPEGTLLPIAFGTPMHIRNDSTQDATFLVMKTPHPGFVGEKDK